MTHVEIDDYQCPYCNGTMADLDMDTRKYTCYKCGKVGNEYPSDAFPKQTDGMEL